MDTHFAGSNLFPIDCRTRLRIRIPSMLRRIDVLAIKMGSNPNWQQCTWCWKWGKTTLYFSDEDIAWGCEPLTDLDYCPTLSISSVDDPRAPFLRCARCLELDEPPWYPNALWRCANAMKLFMPEELLRAEGLLKYMAWFVVENDP